MEVCSANPSAPYSAAGQARREIRLTKETLSHMLGCNRTELIFTSGGTEANNLALKQAAQRHVVLSAIEHKSVLEAAKLHECEITFVLPNEQGCVDPNAVEAAIRPDTALISVQVANNETGAIQPIAAIGAIARRHKILYHADAVQAFGHIPIDVRGANIDLLSASAHKLYGPRGIGFLYIRQGIPAVPIMAGGGQEGGLRAGTENTPAITGFRIAAKLAQADMAERGARLEHMLEIFVETLKQTHPNLIEIASKAPRLPGIRSLCLPGIESEEVIVALDLLGIQVSGGAACGSSQADSSHVLQAMGIPEHQAKSVIRISPGRHTTESMIEVTIDAINSILQK